ncbi:alpha-L-fucosidase 1-like [Aristolochia californica]|uniref:alpha-L-fucosidase 1-like n=1 Tax=Aristolochia californica TaxID=171875 RepID=UPI0035DDFB7A
MSLGSISLLFALLLRAFGLAASKATPPPLPVLPLPTYSQLKWQQREMIMFHHFGVNTFTDSEWGTGHENPSVFNPTGLDTRQWVEVAAKSGFSLAILTAKHHDGFCLWPSRYTDHSVERSNWRYGKGDVVREFTDAAKERGIDVGLYLSPWDRHEKRYGRDVAYNEFYLGQLQELFTRYGRVHEVWFDGAKGANAPNITYYFSSWFSMVEELQSTINIFSDAGPDVRWVGNEMGYSGNTSWSTINRTSLRIGDASLVNYLNTGDPSGTDWVPPECDVSIRKGWFWHKSESPKPLSQLLDIYYKSVGRNCVMLLNVPPNTTGLISESDVQRLGEFHRAIDSIFSVNLATESAVKASSIRGGKNGDFVTANVLDDDHLWTFWAPEVNKNNRHWVELRGEFRFNVVRIQEAIGLGQRIKKHQVFADGRLLARGTTVGYKRLHRLDQVVHCQSLKIKIEESKGLPLISSVGLHFDPFWESKHGT